MDRHFALPLAHLYTSVFLKGFHREVQLRLDLYPSRIKRPSLSPCRKICLFLKEGSTRQPAGSYIRLLIQCRTSCSRQTLSFLFELRLSAKSITNHKDWRSLQHIQMSITTLSLNFQSAGLIFKSTKKIFNHVYKFLSQQNAYAVYWSLKDHSLNIYIFLRLWFLIG